MASKYSKQLQIPEEFPELMKDFTREALREQQVIRNQTELFSFAATYFRDLVNKRNGLADAEQPEASTDQSYISMTDSELESYVREIFRAADGDNNGFLDQTEFKRVFKGMSDFLRLSTVDVQRLLAEADENDDGVVDYKEFIPIAIEIIQSLRAQQRYKDKQFERKMVALDDARNVLLHGMTKDQVTSLLSEVFHRSDTDGNGTLNRVEFMNCIRDADLGFTRKEINVLMSQVDGDGDGRITYNEFVPICYELLVQMFANELIECPKDEQQLASFFTQLFLEEDKEGTGYLSLQQLKRLIRKADLGLTRLQITAILAEAQENPNGGVDYEQFAKSVSAMVLEMLNFDVQHRKSEKTHSYRESTAYHEVFGYNQHDFDQLLKTSLTAHDDTAEGKLPVRVIREAIQRGFPEMTERQLRGLLSLVEINPDTMLADYQVLLERAFQSLQWLQEHDALAE